MATADFQLVWRLARGAERRIVSAREVGNAVEIWVQSDAETFDMQRFHAQQELNAHLLSMRVRLLSEGWEIIERFPVSAATRH